MKITKEYLCQRPFFFNFCKGTILFSFRLIFSNFALTFLQLEMENESSIFSRLSLLVGNDTMDIIKKKKVIIFGVGGVGSWCAESLVRSGIHNLTIVDNDKVCISNVNRQLQATTKTVGLVKVEVLKQRLLEINPQAQITAIEKTYSAQTDPFFQLEQFDYIIDAIDSLENKATLMLRATECQGKFFSSMGAAFKMSTSKIQVAEFWKVYGCPLARAVRQKFKKNKTFPKKKFLCVFSPEVLTNKDKNISATKLNGTIVHITAIFGFTIAGLVMQDITGR